MKVRTEGIVLRNPVRHSDSADILTLYTPDRGRLSVVVGAASPSRSARARSAALQPLARIEFQIPSSTPQGRLPRATSIALRVPYRSLYWHPVKSALALMMSEFLSRLLRDSSPDSKMYRYIADSVELLDDIDDDARMANFHIAFLAGMATFAGIAPDVSGYRRGALFDMVAGRYSLMPPPHRSILMGDEAAMPLLLSRMNFANQHCFRFNRQQRRRIVENILRYFGLHFPGTDRLEAIDVLYTLFD